MSEEEFLVNIIKNDSEILYRNSFGLGVISLPIADIVKSIKKIRNSFIPLEWGRTFMCSMHVYVFVSNVQVWEQKEFHISWLFITRRPSTDHWWFMLWNNHETLKLVKMLKLKIH